MQPFASSYPDTCQGYTAELGIMNTNLVLAAGGGSGSNKLCSQTDSDCIRHTVLVPSLYGGGCPANMNQDWADAYENQKGIYQNRINELYSKANEKSCIKPTLSCALAGPQLKCEQGLCKQ